MQLFKFLFFLVFLLVFLSSVHAAVFLVSPFEQRLSDGELVELGGVLPGDSFEVIVSNESGLSQGAFWSQAVVENGAIPVGWSAVDSVVGEKRLVVRIFVPKNAVSNVYQFRVTLVNPDFGLKESFVSRVRVRDGLLSAVVNNAGINQFPLTGEKVVYSISLRNDSIAPQDVRIFSTLPGEWFLQKSVELPAKQTVSVPFEVTARVAGKKDFEIIVFSENSSGVVSSFNSSLGVKPTLVGKFGAPVEGLGFFSFSILPFYFFDSFVFSFFK